MGRDADVESAEGPLTSRGSQDVSRAQARRGLKEALHLRLGSALRCGPKSTARAHSTRLARGATQLATRVAARRVARVAMAAST